MSETSALTFERPPIAEVVAAVSFDRLPGATAAQLGVFWRDSLSSEFPDINVMPPVSRPVERFGNESTLRDLPFVIESDYRSPRLWFISALGDEVVQVQDDWFACNWRRVEPGSIYSHWPRRKQVFSNWFRQFDTFVAEISGSSLVPTQCEITYINHIESGLTWKSHSEASKIFRSVGASDMPGFLERENVRFNQSFVIHDDSNAQMGRLHISVQPALKADDRSPIYVLELTARGNPASPDLEGVEKFFNLGRQAINETFAAITSDEIHREWGVK
jgi:uncharacterized protein (TIGR04255 family)